MKADQKAPAEPAKTARCSWKPAPTTISATVYEIRAGGVWHYHCRFAPPAEALQIFAAVDAAGGKPRVSEWTSVAPIAVSAANRGGH